MNGKIISIVGSPGVGKSFLVKQLACKNCLPAFFEGEVGIFPKRVLAVLNAEKDSPKRFEWIIERTKEILERAQIIANSGVDVYIDGDVLQVEAWLKAETGEYSREVLSKWLEENRHLMADKVVVLTASEERLRKNMESRARVFEQSDFIQNRAFRIQKAALELPSKYNHVQMFDRSDYEFTDENDLEKIASFIKSISSLER